MCSWRAWSWLRGSAWETGCFPPSTTMWRTPSCSYASSVSSITSTWSAPPAVLQTVSIFRLMSYVIHDHMGANRMLFMQISWIGTQNKKTHLRVCCKCRGRQVVKQLCDKMFCQSQHSLILRTHVSYSVNCTCLSVKYVYLHSSQSILRERTYTVQRTRRSVHSMYM